MAFEITNILLFFLSNAFCADGAQNVWYQARPNYFNSETYSENLGFDQTQSIQYFSNTPVYNAQTNLQQYQPLFSADSTTPSSQNGDDFLSRLGLNDIRDDFEMVKPALSNLFYMQNLINRNTAASLLERLSSLGQSVQTGIEKIIGGKTGNTISSQPNNFMRSLQKQNVPIYTYNSIGTQSERIRKWDVGIEFWKAKIVPDLLTLPPETILTVQFMNGAKVQLGNAIAANATYYPPIIVDWITSPNDTLYTLLVIDFGTDNLDQSINYWTVTNIAKNKIISEANVITEYVPAAPNAARPNSRITYLLYKQKTLIFDIQHGYVNNRMYQRRLNFDLSTFVSKHSLGRPLAGNYFLTSCDSSVEQTYKQLGIHVRPGC